MKIFKVITAIMLGVALSGCAAVDITSRNASYDPSTGGLFGSKQTTTEPVMNVQVSSVRVDDLTVTVPQSLIVSEENSYYPSGDIVWRGEPMGNRHAQVQAMFEDGFSRGLSGLGGSVPAKLEIEVQRFHSITEITRYTFGGVHSIRFVMTLRHAETGELLVEPKRIKADLKAFGGQRALDAEREGQTQRVRVVAHLANVIRAELGRPPMPMESEAETPKEDLSF